MPSKKLKKKKFEKKKVRMQIFRQKAPKLVAGF